MDLKEAYLENVAGDVENLSVRVALLKNSFARQKVNVKLEHYWELEYVRARFAEFKHRVQDLEDADDRDVPRAEEALESSWNELNHSVDTLLSALS